MCTAWLFEWGGRFEGWLDKALSGRGLPGPFLVRYGCGNVKTRTLKAPGLRHPKPFPQSTCQSVTRPEGNEMQIAFPVMSSQISRHRRKEQPTLSFRKGGAPSSHHPTVNFESGILCPCSEVNHRVWENSMRHPPITVTAPEANE
jgi:hypothetical protein